MAGVHHQSDALRGTDDVHVSLPPKTFEQELAEHYAKVRKAIDRAVLERSEVYRLTCNCSWCRTMLEDFRRGIDIDTEWGGNA